MSEALKSVFAAVGAIALLTVLLCMVLMIICYLTNIIEEARRQHRIKHRFNKPPTAKCYCRDCKFWNPENGECHVSHTAKGYCMADNWFCYSAEPVTGEIGKQREEWIRKNTKERRKKDDKRRTIKQSEGNGVWS